MTQLQVGQDDQLGITDSFGTNNVHFSRNLWKNVLQHSPLIIQL